MGAKKEHTYENYIFGDSSSASNAMKMYLKEIEEYKMLTASEEIELAKKLIILFLKQKKNLLMPITD